MLFFSHTKLNYGLTDDLFIIFWRKREGNTPKERKRIAEERKRDKIIIKVITQERKRDRDKVFTGYY